MTDTAKEIKNCVNDAGQMLKEGFYSKKDVNYKADIDLVTSYDVAIEKKLTEDLNRILPDFQIIGEEASAEDGFSTPDKAVYVDPIDGTTNFVHGFPFTCVSVGVWEKNTPVMGFVYNPLMDEFFTAEAGGGAFLNGEPISVSKSTELKTSLVATGFPYTVIHEDSNKLVNILRDILSSTRGIRRPGSAALDLCYTAKGVFDIYYEFNLNPWDVAAGILIVREAGGSVSGLKGGYEIGSDFILADNGNLTDDMRNIILKHA